MRLAPGRRAWTRSVVDALSLALLATGILSVEGQEYRYDQLWPSLQQPWYFNSPEGLAADRDGAVLVVGSRNSRVQRFTSDGQLLTEWGKPGDDAGAFENPTGVAVDSQNNVYVTDTYNHRVQVFRPDGVFLRQLGEIGSGVGQFNGSEGNAIHRNDRVYVVDSPNFRVTVYQTDGAFLYAWGAFGTGPGQFRKPTNIALSTFFHNYYDVLFLDFCAILCLKRWRTKGCRGKVHIVFC
jgi:DNA-binding beta-propeller fold protein YncE